MNSTPPSIPTLRSLYWRDLTIQRAAKAGVFALLVGFGIRWASQPVNSVVKVERPPQEEFLIQWAVPGGILIAALAVLVLVRRYLWVKKVICHGVPIKGTVEEVDVYSREASSNSDTSPAFNRAKIHTYYAIIRYTAQGAERKIRVKLPNSPSVYQISKGRDVDLIAHDSAPDKPLIRAVYLGRF